MDNKFVGVKELIGRSEAKISDVLGDMGHDLHGVKKDVEVLKMSEKTMRDELKAAVDGGGLAQGSRAEKAPGSDPPKDEKEGGTANKEEVAEEKTQEKDSTADK